MPQYDSKIARADKLSESLASLYTSACTEDLVELMRAVLLTIDYEPPRFLQSKGKAPLERSKMTNLEVARTGSCCYDL